MVLNMYVGSGTGCCLSRVYVSRESFCDFATTLPHITHDYGDRPAGAAQKQPDWLLRVISRNYKNVLLAKNLKYLSKIYLISVTIGALRVKDCWYVSTI